MDNFRNSVKNIMFVFLLLFVGLITYIAYFQTFQANSIAEKEGNRRIWARRNEIERGPIYDREGNVLTKTKKESTLIQSRTYIYGDLYTSTLGYINNKYGLTGLEASYDKELTSYSSAEVGLKEFFTDFSFNKVAEIFRDRNKKEEKVGNGVHTTLDKDIQKAAYDALGDKVGAVVALNPKTGEILAMVSKPTYDPNDLDNVMKLANEGKYTDSPLINRAIGGLYPPGSTFKTVTTTSALQNIDGIQERVFTDNGKIVFNNSYSLSNSGGEAWGNIDLKQAFTVSSNVVFGTISGELGNKTLKKTAEKFGFNKQLEINGCQNSQIAISKFPELKDYEVGMIAQSGIGQGSVLATPMQMAMVASTIANDGILMQPKLVNKVTDMKGNIVSTVDSKKLATVMNEEDASTIKAYMVNMVNSSSSLYELQQLNAAGKTGTADHLDKNGNLATPHSWFISFAPANNPKVAVAVIVENGGYGAQSAAPIATTVIRSALSE